MQKKETILQQIPSLLLAWYDCCARVLPWRENTEAYGVWISEIMLQQTRVEAVKISYRRFLQTFPDVYVLAAAPEEQVLKLWEGLGYYSRARNLQKAAQKVVQDYHGIFPSEKSELMRLPGIGEYTAGAIASIAFGKAEPAVDGNVLRVISRLLASKHNISEPHVKKEMSEQIRAILPIGRTGDFNQALMDLGATVCIPNGAPLCENCPLAALCEGRKQGIAEQLPVKEAKKVRKAEERTVFLIVHEQEAVFCKRPNRGLLAGMWELPNVSGALTEQQARERLEQWGFCPTELSQSPPSKHIFTHREWLMSAYLVRVREKTCQEGFLWADEKKMDEELSVPSAFAAYQKVLRRELKSR